MVPLLRIEGEHRGQVNLCWKAQVILQAAGLRLVVRAVEVGVVGQGVGALLQPSFIGLVWGKFYRKPPYLVVKTCKNHGFL